MRTREEAGEVCARQTVNWSGKRDLNSRPSPWQGDALPLSYSRSLTVSTRGGILLGMSVTVKLPQYFCRYPAIQEISFVLVAFVTIA